MNKYLSIFLGGLLVIAVSSCDRVTDKTGSEPGNAVYMENSSSSGVVSMEVSTHDGGSTFVTVRLADFTDSPVTVLLGVSETLLDQYNVENDLDLASISPDEVYFIGPDGSETKGEISVTIEGGEFQATVEVGLRNIDEAKYPFSGKFAIPVKILDANGLPVLSEPVSTIIRLDRQLITSIGKISRGNIVLTPKKPFTKPMEEWTFQMSAIYSSLNRSNLTTAYMSNAGGGEFYTRISANTGIQVKNGRDGDDTWTQKPLEAGKWLHISYVYKNETLSVYVNGELQKKFETTPLYMAEASAWTIGNDGYNNDYIREVRFWDRALSDAEMLDKLYLPLDPESEEGLLMYMPVTKESELGELTGDWEVTTAENTVVEYVDNVLFPADKLEIVGED